MFIFNPLYEMIFYRFFFINTLVREISIENDKISRNRGMKKMSDVLIESFIMEIGNKSW